MKTNMVVNGEGRKLDFGTFRCWVKDDGTLTERKSAVLEFEVNPHSVAPPMHIHRTFAEAFYMLDGEIEFIADGDAVVAQVGDFVHVPIGVAHTYRNPAVKPARFLAMMTSSDFIGFFEEFEQLVRTGAVTPQANIALLKKYDTDVVVPQSRGC
ncbi:cupin domain-containing protein [Cohnella caldifontis]|uniref:cupin domain-containing protein n=1 Tax=Cohnella caldifontis TaxID=3027471 RepID=UPI0023EDD0CA|nr:cupin domain-containing protein [Cohnella sp. YIM B05605]